MAHTAASKESFMAPHPGSQAMPRWDTGELVDAPRFNWRNLAAMIGPGLVMGGSAIGGGEWLTGPLVTARFGGALLWLATLSILGQVLYNIEISRYTLDRKSTRLNSSHLVISYAVFCLKKKKNNISHQQHTPLTHAT